MGSEADLWCLAKGISSGYVPLGATAVSAKVVQAFKGADPVLGTINHGYTYGAHPVAAAAALATLDVIELDPQSCLVVYSTDAEPATMALTVSGAVGAALDNLAAVFGGR